MQTISSDEMMVIDANSELLGVGRIVLMENAGRSVAQVLSNALNGVSGKRVLVLCGPGNNGGDGLAAARHLACMGAEVRVLLLTDPSKIRTEECRRNFEAVKNMR
ncbi:MAG: NAD(P)H-hydrate epimerase, partial [Candidatus Caldarchaeum sp.]|nr:NAD(P)H-hydrate epimerase [Candidatus Caldarchaeum sp.]